MPQRAAVPDMYVLDNLADDIESLEDILRMLNSTHVIGWKQRWGRSFERSEVVEALSRLVHDDLVRVSILTSEGKALNELAARQLPPGDYDDVWFAMTPRGRIVHTNWDPETAV